MVDHQPRVMNMMADRLREARERRGWTQMRLAAAAGIKDYQTVAAYEYETIPRADRLVKIAEALEVPVCDLLGVSCQGNTGTRRLSDQISRIEAALVRVKRDLAALSG